MTDFKFAPDGYPFIFGSLFLTLLASLLLLWSWRSTGINLASFMLLGVTSTLFLITMFMAFFFRDPERIAPTGEGLFVSPADGKVILIRELFEPEFLMNESIEMSIFMSPLDVHVNRAPCDGVVSVVRYFPGRFMAAYKDEASIKNENIVMILACEKYKVMVRQVAGFLARRAVCKAEIGDTLRRGERYGIIKFGSRLDVYMPVNTKIKVKVGDRVKAGETVIGGVDYE
ncbi:MAG: phosphatidylserine decarboxylase family protein [Nitrospirota bacterium]